MEIAPLDLVPFAGFGNVRLGMTQDRVRQLLGEPDEAATDKYGDVTLGYQRVGIQCTFSPADAFLLGSITFDSERFLVQGHKVVGVPVARLLELAGQRVLPGLYLEQEFPELGSSNYACEALGLSFWVDGGHVANVTLYPRSDESDDSPIFPGAD